MANEIQVSLSINATKGNGQYQNLPKTFVVDMEGTFFGPSPGALQVSISGTDINLSQFGTPGICFINNMDETYAVRGGIYDVTNDTFYPLFRVSPGGIAYFEMDRSATEESTGTGTLSGGYNSTFQLRAEGGSPNVKVEILEA